VREIRSVRLASVREIRSVRQLAPVDCDRDLIDHGRHVAWLVLHERASVPILPGRVVQSVTLDHGGPGVVQADYPYPVVRNACPGVVTEPVRLVGGLGCCRDDLDDQGGTLDQVGGPPGGDLMLRGRRLAEPG
jgi:hypothetical protein